MIILGKPVSVSKITITPVTNSSVIMSWLYKEDEEHCIRNYTLTIITNSAYSETRFTIITNITIPDLTNGSNYSFIIIPIDTVGIEGTPSSLIQYIWNGMNYTMYIFTHCTSYSTS